MYTYFRVPEPKDRTFAELDLLFERKVSARNFAKTEVDVFDETVDDSVLNKTLRSKHGIAEAEHAEVSEVEAGKSSGTSGTWASHNAATQVGVTGQP